jgi:hypothetical protein
MKFSLKDPMGSIKKIAAFLGKIYTDEQIAELAEFTLFKSMQKQEQNYTLAIRAMQIATDETVFFSQRKNWRLGELLD